MGRGHARADGYRVRGELTPHTVLRGELRLRQHLTEALLHACPEYKTSEDAWASVFEITSYHVQPMLADSLGQAITTVSPWRRHGLGRRELTARVQTRLKYLGEHKPAWTAVGVHQLVEPQALVEVQVKAVAPQLQSRL